jgi:PEP-CTERM motif
MFKKSLLAASLTLGLGLAWATPAAAETIQFNPDGAGALPFIDIKSLDWLPGDAVAVGVSATSPVGTTFQLFYQANLGTSIGTNNLSNYTNNTGAAGTLDSFTVVVGFREQITTSGFDPATNTGNLTFGFVPGGNNFFQIYANTDPGDILSGACFVCGTLVMSGTVDPTVPGGQFVSNFSASTIQALPLDNDGSNDYAGVNTITGTGSVNLSGKVLSANPLFFQGLNGAVISFAFADTNTKLPFQETDPSACFFATTSTGGLTPVCGGTGGATGVAPFVGVGLVGALNGRSGPNLMFQADGNSSFTTVPAAIPEPATMTLFGLGLLGSAAARRRQRNTKK